MFANRTNHHQADHDAVVHDLHEKIGGVSARALVREFAGFSRFDGFRDLDAEESQFGN